MNHKVFKIAEIVDEGRDIKTFLFNESVRAIPGQFVMVWLPQIKVEKPISLSYANPAGITVKRREKSESNFTPTLFELKEGDKVWMSEPKGNGFPLNKLNSSEIYMVAGGTGAAPLSFLSEKLYNANVTTFVGAKSFDQLIFLKRLRRRGEVIVTTEDNSGGEKGLVTDPMRRYKFSRDGKAAICGPEKMEYYSAQILGEHLNHDDICVSIERYMKCAVGLCGSCAFGHYRDCADGPIFTYAQAEAVHDFGKFRRDRTGARDPTFS